MSSALMLGKQEATINSVCVPDMLQMPSREANARIAPGEKRLVCQRKLTHHDQPPTSDLREMALLCRPQRTSPGSLRRFFEAQGKPEQCGQFYFSS